MLKSHYQKACRRHRIKTADRFSEDVKKFNYFGTTLTDKQNNVLLACDAM
jgi:hypothetical protein